MKKRLQLRRESIRVLMTDKLKLVEGRYYETNGYCNSFEGECPTDFCYTKQGDSCGTPAR